MKISYGITVHNEADELNELLKFLIHKTHENDEIVICDDYSDEETQFPLQLHILPTVQHPFNPISFTVHSSDK